MDKDFSERLAQDYISDLELTDCDHIDVGLHCHVLITKDLRVIKIPTVQRDLLLAKREKVSLEYLQRYLSLHVARILAITPAPRAPAGYILEMEHAQGSELTPQDIEGYSDRELKQLGISIGTVLSELHSMRYDTTSIGQHVPTPEIAQELSLLKEKKYWDLLDHTEQKYLIGIYERALSYFQEPIKVQLLHNDFGMNHLFVKNRELSAVIDWDCLKLGDPAQDFRWEVGPRSIHPLCFHKALSKYCENMHPGSTFLGRVRYYNETKVIRALERAFESGDSEQFAQARTRLDQARTTLGL